MDRRSPGSLTSCSTAVASLGILQGIGGRDKQGALRCCRRRRAAAVCEDEGKPVAHRLELDVSSWLAVAGEDEDVRRGVVLFDGSRIGCRERSPYQ